MIRKSSDCCRAMSSLQRLEDEIDHDERRLRQLHFPERHIDTLMGPRRTLERRLRQVIDDYERATQARLPELTNLDGLGEWLIGLRLAAGLDQRTVARRLGVHESAISRGERSAHEGLTVRRAMLLMDAVGARATLRLASLEGPCWRRAEERES